MASSSVVAAKELVKTAFALAVACPGAGVGPFVEQGPVEAFDFAVGPGTARFDKSTLESPGRTDSATS